MDKLDKLYTGTFVVVLVFAIFIFIHYYNKEQITSMDLDQNGNIDNNELGIHIKKEIEKKHSQPPQFKGLVKSSLSGVLRGLLMGFILNGIEGAVTTGIVLGIVNPIMSSIEYKL
jgi:hypothetical protein